MPKKKKTRKQKALADVRRQTEPKITYDAPFESKTQVRGEHIADTSTTVSPPRQAAPRPILTADYRYLGRDLIKTLTLTTVIIAIQLVLKFGTGI